MKFYVHLEEELTPITLVFELTSDETTVADIELIFKQELKTKFNFKTFSSCRISKGKRKRPLPESAYVNDVVTSGEDLYAILASKGDSDHAVPPLLSLQNNEKSHPRQTELIKQECSNPVKSQLQNKSSLTKSEVLKQGQQLEALSHHSHQAVLLYTQWLHSGNSNADVWNRLVSIYIKVTRFDKALRYVEDGLKVHSTCQALQLCYAECLIVENPKKAVEVIMKYSKDLRSSGTGSTSLKHKLQILMCRAYQRMNMIDMAIVMVEGVLRDDQTHQQALIEFAKLTFDLGEEQAIQSITILLAALVKDKDNKTVQQYLTGACRKPGGVQYLQK